MRHQYICPYGPYLAGDDRYINLVVASAEHWERFCNDVVEMQSWLEDPRFATMMDRHRNREIVDNAVENVIATRPRDEWAERLADAGLPYGMVRTMAEVVEHPQLIERGTFVEATSPVGKLPLVAFPLASSARARHIPELGEHTDVLLKELDYDETEIAALRRAGVVG